MAELDDLRAENEQLRRDLDDVREDLEHGRQSNAELLEICDSEAARAKAAEARAEKAVAEAIYQKNLLAGAESILETVEAQRDRLAKTLRGARRFIRQPADEGEWVRMARESAIEKIDAALTDTPPTTPCPKCEEMGRALRNLSDGVTRFCKHEHDFYEWICDPNEEAIRVLSALTDTPEPAPCPKCEEAEAERDAAHEEACQHCERALDMEAALRDVSDIPQIVFDHTSHGDDDAAMAAIKRMDDTIDRALTDTPEPKATVSSPSSSSTR